MDTDARGRLDYALKDARRAANALIGIYLPHFQQQQKLDTTSEYKDHQYSLQIAMSGDEDWTVDRVRWAIVAEISGALIDDAGANERDELVRNLYDNVRDAVDRVYEELH